MTEKVILVSVLAVAVATLVVLVTAQPKFRAPLGLSLDEPSFNTSNVIDGSVTCRNDTVAGSSSIVAAAPGRMDFKLRAIGTAVSSICRQSLGACTATSGIAIAGSSSLPAVYEQRDAYIGPYTCMGQGATTTIYYTEAK